MRCFKITTTLQFIAHALAILLLTAGVSPAQETVNLTAARQAITTPDGVTTTMWGWICSNNASANSITLANGPGTCGTLSGQPQAGQMIWQPPLITVPYGNSLTVNLQNNLPVETSFTIVGPLVGGGVGHPVRETSPRNHPTQTVTTWTNNIPTGIALLRDPIHNKGTAFVRSCRKPLPAVRSLTVGPQTQFLLAPT